MSSCLPNPGLYFCLGPVHLHGSDARLSGVAGLKQPKVLSAPQRRKAVRHLIKLFQVSERRACRLTGLSRTACRYVSRAPSQEPLRQRIVDIARTRVRYGYKRIHILLKREGIHVNYWKFHPCHGVKFGGKGHPLVRPCQRLDHFRFPVT